MYKRQVLCSCICFCLASKNFHFICFLLTFFFLPIFQLEQQCFLSFLCFFSFLLAFFFWLFRLMSALLILTFFCFFRLLSASFLCFQQEGFLSRFRFLVLCFLLLLLPIGVVAVSATAAPGNFPSSEWDPLFTDYLRIKLILYKVSTCLLYTSRCV